MSLKVVNKPYELILSVYARLDVPLAAALMFVNDHIRRRETLARNYAESKNCRS